MKTLGRGLVAFFVVAVSWAIIAYGAGDPRKIVAVKWYGLGIVPMVVFWSILGYSRRFEHLRQLRNWTFAFWIVVATLTILPRWAMSLRLSASLPAFENAIESLSGAEATRKDWPTGTVLGWYEVVFIEVERDSNGDVVRAYVGLRSDELLGDLGWFYSKRKPIEAPWYEVIPHWFVFRRDP